MLRLLARLMSVRDLCKQPGGLAHRNNGPESTGAIPYLGTRHRACRRVTPAVVWADDLNHEPQERR